MSSRVITPSGRMGTIVHVREGVALVRHGRHGRAYYAVRDLEPARPRPIVARVSDDT